MKMQAEGYLSFMDHRANFTQGKRTLLSLTNGGAVSFFFRFSASLRQSFNFMGLLRLNQTLTWPKGCFSQLATKIGIISMPVRTLWCTARNVLPTRCTSYSVPYILGGRSCLGLSLTHLNGLCSPLNARSVSTKQRRKWKVRKYHFKLRLKRTMRKMRVPYVSSKSRGQVKKKPILYDFRPYLRRKLKRAER